MKQHTTMLTFFIQGIKGRCIASQKVNVAPVRISERNNKGSKGSGVVLMQRFFIYLN